MEKKFEEFHKLLSDKSLVTEVNFMKQIDIPSKVKRNILNLHGDGYIDFEKFSQITRNLSIMKNKDLPTGNPARDYRRFLIKQRIRNTINELLDVVEIMDKQLHSEVVESLIKQRNKMNKERRYRCQVIENMIRQSNNYERRTSIQNDECKPRKPNANWKNVCYCYAPTPMNAKSNKVSDGDVMWCNNAVVIDANINIEGVMDEKHASTFSNTSSYQKLYGRDKQDADPTIKCFSIDQNVSEKWFSKELLQIDHKSIAQYWNGSKEKIILSAKTQSKSSPSFKIPVRKLPLIQSPSESRKVRIIDPKYESSAGSSGVSFQIIGADNRNSSSTSARKTKKKPSSKHTVVEIDGRRRDRRTGTLVYEMSDDSVRDHSGSGISAEIHNGILKRTTRNVDHFPHHEKKYSTRYKNKLEMEKLDVEELLRRSHKYSSKVKPYKATTKKRPHSEADIERKHRVKLGYNVETERSNRSGTKYSRNPDRDNLRLVDKSSKFIHDKRFSKGSLYGKSSDEYYQEKQRKPVRKRVYDVDKGSLNGKSSDEYYQEKQKTPVTKRSYDVDKGSLNGKSSDEYYQEKQRTPVTKRSYDVDKGSLNAKSSDEYYQEKQITPVRKRAYDVDKRSLNGRSSDEYYQEKQRNKLVRKGAYDVDKGSLNGRSSDEYYQEKQRTPVTKRVCDVDKGSLNGKSSDEYCQEKKITPVTKRVCDVDKESFNGRSSDEYYQEKQRAPVTKRSYDVDKGSLNGESSDEYCQEKQRTPVTKRVCDVDKGSLKGKSSDEYCQEKQETPVTKRVYDLDKRDPRKITKPIVEVHKSYHSVSDSESDDTCTTSPQQSVDVSVNTDLYSEIIQEPVNKSVVEQETDCSGLEVLLSNTFCINGVKVKKVETKVRNYRNLKTACKSKNNVAPWKITSFRGGLVENKEPDSVTTDKNNTILLSTEENEHFDNLEELGILNENVKHTKQYYKPVSSIASLRLKKIYKNTLETPSCEKKHDLKNFEKLEYTVEAVKYAKQNDDESISLKSPTTKNDIRGSSNENENDNLNDLKYSEKKGKYFKQCYKPISSKLHYNYNVMPPNSEIELDSLEGVSFKGDDVEHAKQYYKPVSIRKEHNYPLFPRITKNKDPDVLKEWETKGGNVSLAKQNYKAVSSRGLKQIYTNASSGSDEPNHLSDILEFSGKNEQHTKQLFKVVILKKTMQCTCDIPESSEKDKNVDVEHVKVDKSVSSGEPYLYNNDNVSPDSEKNKNLELFEDLKIQEKHKDVENVKEYKSVSSGEPSIYNKTDDSPDSVTNENVELIEDLKIQGEHKDVENMKEYKSVSSGEPSIYNKTDDSPDSVTNENVELIEDLKIQGEHKDVENMKEYKSVSSGEPSIYNKTDDSPDSVTNENVELSEDLKIQGEHKDVEDGNEHKSNFSEKQGSEKMEDLGVLKESDSTVRNIKNADTENMSSSSEESVKFKRVRKRRGGFAVDIEKLEELEFTGENVNVVTKKILEDINALDGVTVLSDGPKDSILKVAGENGSITLIDKDKLVAYLQLVSRSDTSNQETNTTPIYNDSVSCYTDNMVVQDPSEQVLQPETKEIMNEPLELEKTVDIDALTKLHKASLEAKSGSNTTLEKDLERKIKKEPTTAILPTTIPRSSDTSLTTSRSCCGMCCRRSKRDSGVTYMPPHDIRKHSERFETSMDSEKRLFGTQKARTLKPDRISFESKQVRLPTSAIVDPPSKPQQESPPELQKEASPDTSRESLEEKIEIEREGNTSPPKSHEESVRESRPTVDLEELKEPFKHFTASKESQREPKEEDVGNSLIQHLLRNHELQQHDKDQEALAVSKLQQSVIFNEALDEVDVDKLPYINEEELKELQKDKDTENKHMGNLLVKQIRRSDNPEVSHLLEVMKERQRRSQESFRSVQGNKDEEERIAMLRRLNIELDDSESSLEKDKQRSVEDTTEHHKNVQPIKLEKKIRVQAFDDTKQIAEDQLAFDEAVKRLYD